MRCTVRGVTRSIGPAPCSDTGVSPAANQTRPSTSTENWPVAWSGVTVTVRAAAEQKKKESAAARATTPKPRIEFMWYISVLRTFHKDSVLYCTVL